MRRIHSDLFWLQSFGGFINSYVWNGDTLLDTGAPVVAKVFLREAKQAGIPSTSLTNVLLSHCHVDHAGGLYHLHHPLHVYGAQEDMSVLQGACKAPTYHPRFGFLVEAAEKLLPVVRLAGNHTAHSVGEGQSAQGWQAIGVPGHTPGSVCWYQPETRTIFVGDVLINHLGMTLGPSPLFSQDYPQAVQTLQRIKELDIETVLFGHGVPMVKDAEKRIHAVIDRTTERLARRLSEKIPGTAL
jgi:glyoxylase-like metal-dependent hydrolase (beta-lactamase superfamily II)